MPMSSTAVMTQLRGYEIMMFVNVGLAANAV